MYQNVKVGHEWNQSCLRTTQNKRENYIQMQAFSATCHKVYTLSALPLVTTEIKSQIINQVMKPNKKDCAAIIIHNLVPGGYKHGDLALQVGGVSDETVKYGREFYWTST
jgi:hypothetical protein